MVSLVGGIGSGYWKIHLYSGLTHPREDWLDVALVVEEGDCEEVEFAA